MNRIALILLAVSLFRVTVEWRQPVPDWASIICIEELPEPALLYFL